MPFETLHYDILASIFEALTMLAPEALPSLALTSKALRNVYASREVALLVNAMVAFKGGSEAGYVMEIAYRELYDTRPPLLAGAGSAEEADRNSQEEDGGPQAAVEEQSSSAQYQPLPNLFDEFEFMEQARLKAIMRRSISVYHRLVLFARFLRALFLLKNTLRLRPDYYDPLDRWVDTVIYYASARKTDSFLRRQEEMYWGNIERLANVDVALRFGRIVKLIGQSVGSLTRDASEKYGFETPQSFLMDGEDVGAMLIAEDGWKPVGWLLGVEKDRVVAWEEALENAKVLESNDGESLRQEKLEEWKIWMASADGGIARYRTWVNEGMPFKLYGNWLQTSS